MGRGVGGGEGGVEVGEKRGGRERNNYEWFGSDQRCDRSSAHNANITISFCCD